VRFPDSYRVELIERGDSGARSRATWHRSSKEGKF
jgi:hypothetical protein